MRLTSTKKEEQAKRNKLILMLHDSGYSYAEISTKLDNEISRQRVHQIVTELTSP